MTRNVRWHEDRQERAEATARRYAYRAKREIDRGIDLRNQAYKLSAVKKAKLKEKLNKQADAALQRGRVWLDKADALRKASVKYGRAKSRIGVYDSEGGRGWVDRDRR